MLSQSNRAKSVAALIALCSGDRAAERARRLHLKLGGSGRLDDRVPNVPPKGMHSSTYLATVMKYVAARDQVTELARAMADRRFRTRVRNKGNSHALSFP
jgi:hypothetical protein